MFLIIVSMMVVAAFGAAADEPTSLSLDQIEEHLQTLQRKLVTRAKKKRPISKESIKGLNLALLTAQVDFINKGISVEDSLRLQTLEAEFQILKRQLSKEETSVVKTQSVSDLTDAAKRLLNRANEARGTLMEGDLANAVVICEEVLTQLDQLPFAAPTEYLVDEIRLICRVILKAGDAREGSQLSDLIIPIEVTKQTCVGFLYRYKSEITNVEKALGEPEVVDSRLEDLVKAKEFLDKCLIRGYISESKVEEQRLRIKNITESVLQLKKRIDKVLRRLGDLYSGIDYEAMEVEIEVMEGYIQKMRNFPNLADNIDEDIETLDRAKRRAAALRKEGQALILAKEQLEIFEIQLSHPDITLQDIIESVQDMKKFSQILIKSEIDKSMGRPLYRKLTELLVQNSKKCPQ